MHPSPVSFQGLTDSIVTTASAPSDTNNTAGPRPGGPNDRVDEGQLMIGVAFAFVGNLGIAASLCVQKKAHNEIVSGGDMIKFYQSPLWWVGMACNILGELGNLLAYGFAPASVVAPVGAIGVVGNCLFAWYFLHERFGFRAILGAVVVMIGVTLVVLGAPAEPKLDITQFHDLALQPLTIAYFSVACVAAIVLYGLSKRAVSSDALREPGTYAVQQTTCNRRHAPPRYQHSSARLRREPPMRCQPVAEQSSGRAVCDRGGGTVGCDMFGVGGQIGGNAYIRALVTNLK
jgi:multidrug transporter EmrE-like cation transporter